MVKIINPMHQGSDIGAAISNAAARAFGGDRLGAGLKRQKLYDMQRESVETGNLANLVGAGTIDENALASAAVLSGYNPGQLNDLVLGKTARTAGATAPATQNAQVGAGQSFNNTADAFQQRDATDRRGQDIRSADTRYGVDRRFDATTRGQDLRASSTAPAAEFNQYHQLWLQQNPGDEVGAKQFAFEQVSKSKGISTSVGPDGTVTTTIGGPSSSGLAKKVVGDEQGRALEIERYLVTSNAARNLLDDPTRFGVVGSARSFAQNAAQLINGMAQLSGKGNAQTLISDAQRDLVQNRIDPGLLPQLFDPTLDAVDTVWGLLVYQGASALAGQSGRGLSDNDVKRFMGIFGDPKSMFSSAESMKARLDMADNLVAGNQNVTNRALGRPEVDVPDAPTVQPGQVIRRGNVVIERID